MEISTTSVNKVNSKNINEKIAELPSKDKYKFWSELDTILNDRYYSAQYGIMGNDYASLPIQVLQKTKEKLYHKLFENHNNSKKKKGLENTSN
ncbi:MAG: hypothetical protein ACP5NZ_00670 [Nanobdellota archaeon]